MMQFIDMPFPPGTSLFPPHEVVKQYLHKYAEELRPLIRFQSLILNVQLKTQHPHAEWIVTWRDLKTTETLSAQFDAVIVANGHHNDPYIPDIAGLTQWTQVFPGSIIHSASYRRPESFSNKVSRFPLPPLQSHTQITAESYCCRSFSLGNRYRNPDRECLKASVVDLRAN